LDAANVIAAYLWGRPLGDVTEVAKDALEALREEGFLVIPKDRLRTVGAQQFTSALMLDEIRMDVPRFKEHITRSLGRMIGYELVSNKSNGVQLKEQRSVWPQDGTCFRIGVTIVKDKDE
jgi:hypothetical protein